MGVKINRNVRFAAVTAAMTLLAATVQGVTTAGAATPQNWPAGVPVPATPNCSLQGGGQPLLPLSASVLPGGGEQYTYVIDGTENDYILPPAGFKPVTASAGQLDEYGFLPRPTNSAALAAWTDRMSSYRGAALPSLCRVEAGTNATGINSGTDSQGNTSPNWGGYVATAGAGGNNRYKEVEAQYTEPVHQNCNCSNPTDANMWAGIGGWAGSESLIQAGTDMPNSGGQYAWYEYLKPCATDPTQACGPNEISVASVSSGDTIFTSTSYDQANNLAHFEVDDNGTAVLAKVVTGLGGSYYDGTYAEWIAERPTYKDSNNKPYYENLTNFGQVNFSNCRAEYTDGSLHNIQNETHTHVSLHPNGGNLLINPNNLSNGSFVDTWVTAS